MERGSSLVFIDLYLAIAVATAIQIDSHAFVVSFFFLMETGIFFLNSRVYFYDIMSTFLLYY